MSGQRRLDRITDPGYVDGLDERTTAEIRSMRDECEEEESGVSYARRLLQGKLDIIRAEVVARRDRGSATAASILAELPSILGDEERRPVTQVRVARFLVPPVVAHHRRSVERLVGDEILGTLHERSDEELAGLVERLSDKEAELSALRRTLLEHIDRLQAELTQRYKSGAADVGDVLVPPAG